MAQDCITIHDTELWYYYITLIGNLMKQQQYSSESSYALSVCHEKVRLVYYIDSLHTEW